MYVDDQVFERRYARARSALPKPLRARPSPETTAPQDPTAGWPSNEWLYTDAPAQVRRTVFRPTERMLRSTPAMVCAGEDPLSMALREAQATLDHPQSFRLSGAARQLNAPWFALPKRMKSGLSHIPLCGAWVGPAADGALTGYLNVPLPSIRERSPWDISTLLGCPNQVSNPASMNADAALGFSATGYQYADIALGNFEATPGILFFWMAMRPRATQPRNLKPLYNAPKSAATPVPRQPRKWQFG